MLGASIGFALLGIPCAVAFKRRCPGRKASDSRHVTLS